MRLLVTNSPCCLNRQLDSSCISFHSHMSFQTSVKTIQVLHRVLPSGKTTVWRFCTTSDGGFIIRKNGWSEVRNCSSFNHLIQQYHAWSAFTDSSGQKTFKHGMPAKQVPSPVNVKHNPVVQTVIPEVMSVQKQETVSPDSVLV